MKKIICALLCVLMILSVLPVTLAEDNQKLTVLFTHDTHDYMYPTATLEYEKLVEHGGMARLCTAVKQNSDQNTLFLDGGDFSMGTLYQAAYSTDAYELRLLGSCGCAVTTFGNHEFDYGADGVAKMLRAAIKSGDKLPQIVQSNIDFSGSISKEQKDLKEALDEYGAKEYTILNVAGYKIGVFGLVGYDCIECIQTPLKYKDYIAAAKSTVAALKGEKCDMIIALSHSGTDGNGKTGEDIELAKAVSGINLIISSHSHSTYSTPVTVNGTVIASCGEYLKNLGKISFVKENGKLKVDKYSLIPLNSTVKEDETVKQKTEEYKNNINNNYLKDEGVKFDDVICHSKYDLISLQEMYATHKEYTMGNIIADSYLYEAKRNGINDIDVALVGLGTIRSSVKRGDITVADAFEICSLGVGGDGSAGHPIACAYISGKELKLLTELDASLGNLVSSIKMSYSGLSYTFNTKRMPLDRVTDVHLVRADGTTEEIKDNHLYKVAANMYAINMLGMLNGLTKGVLSITPKDKSGNAIKDFYTVTLKNTSGKEIKEWVALKNYLSSFAKNENGIPELPDYYAKPLNRKCKTAKSDIKSVVSFGAATNIIPVSLFSIVVFFTLLAGAVVLIRRLVRKRKKNKK